MSNQYRSVLAGASGTGGDALPAEVLSGKTFTNDNGPQTGTMTNNGAVSQTLTAGQSYTIPAGYHNGNGIVSAENLPLESGYYVGPDLSGPAAIVSGTTVSSGYQPCIVNVSGLSGTCTITGQGTPGICVLKNDGSYSLTSGNNTNVSFNDDTFMIIPLSVSGNSFTFTITLS